jgi:hypothetical protein
MKKMLAGCGDAARWLAKNRAAGTGTKEAGPAPLALRGEYQFPVLRQPQPVFAPVVHDHQFLFRPQELGAGDAPGFERVLRLDLCHLQTVIILIKQVKQ